ncbi:MAG: ribosome silencing factor [Cytophagales bacterium]|nr:ribosome silencing factor [Cytophagales bacterium]
MNSSELINTIVHGMQEKKAEDIIIIDLKSINSSVADAYVICSGNSDTQIGAISDSVEKEVKEAHAEHPWQVEGKMNREWILLDYEDVVAHVFKKDSREFYALEELWSDAKIIRIENV